ncbi:Sua5/YciO/YrdC/YwlC family protein [Thiohalobacter sp. IOR34]|uniref:L-threonylcarbamoyladenylate synthase n=1 Tax=Thiohalobacter sp. IOR34 TaxID=3057176 RepID=UPI0025B18723|nr:Sua5/YciO/YrdC/YwlC family protein [Thiohalobacter sp. IOR34]WJW75616.1 Sua5/YciO/YrdC/YwlC family protein [Thiohalobacter sp. IOR34]
MPLRPWQLRQACQYLHAGGLLAYPTEAVYGLGCNPLDRDAVLRLLLLKQRPAAKGLILISDDFARLQPFLEPLPAARRRAVLASWPGPVTWAWPVRPWVPYWLRGEHSTLAVRVTAHPPAVELCRAFGLPLVSTSANPAARRPARTPLKVRKYFDGSIDCILHAATGGDPAPTPIRDARSGRWLRPA